MPIDRVFMWVHSPRFQKEIVGKGIDQSPKPLHIGIMTDLIYLNKKIIIFSFQQLNVNKLPKLKYKGSDNGVITHFAFRTDSSHIKSVTVMAEDCTYWAI